MCALIFNVTPAFPVSISKMLCCFQSNQICQVYVYTPLQLCLGYSNNINTILTPTSYSQNSRLSSTLLPQLQPSSCLMLNILHLQVFLLNHGFLLYVNNTLQHHLGDIVQQSITLQPYTSIILWYQGPSNSSKGGGENSASTVALPSVLSLLFLLALLVLF